MQLSTSEINQLGQLATPDFECLVSLYSEEKYPPQEYRKFKSSFSSVSEKNTCIEDAMKWKWGHWGKENYPQHHKDLIKKIERTWPSFSQSNEKKSPQETFNFWRKSLGPSNRYISVAFITHLVHPASAPIIDQHNFRAMNYFMKLVKPNHKSKKRPSTWKDIEELNYFLNALSTQLNQQKERVDRFLMMFGRYRVKR